MKVAIITENSGVEAIELSSPREALEGAGCEVVHLAPEHGDVETMNHDTEKAETVQSDGAISEANAGDFDALFIPGGTVNADRLRLDSDAVEFVKAFCDAEKPIAAICHGPWLLVEADIVDGKNLTSFPSLETDITNAGGTWADKEVIHCSTDGWELVTSRKPDDLEAFNAKMLQVFQEAV